MHRAGRGEHKWQELALRVSGGDSERKRHGGWIQGSLISFLACFTFPVGRLFRYLVRQEGTVEVSPAGECRHLQQRYC